MSKNGFHPVDVSAAEFDAEVRQADIPTIVDFWAEWCGPCRMLTPFLSKFAAEFDGKIRIVKVNFDDNRELAQSFGIDSIPRLLFFVDGEVVEEQKGLPDYPDLKKWFDSCLARVQSDAGEAEESEHETAFAAAVAVAGEQYDSTVTPARDTFQAAIKPVTDQLEAYKEELEGDGVEGDELQEKLRARQQELWPQIEDHQAEYAAVAKPASASYVEAIEAATEAFLAGATASGDVAEASSEPAGKVCAIGDPDCQS